MYDTLQKTDVDLSITEDKNIYKIPMYIKFFVDKTELFKY